MCVCVRTRLAQFCVTNHCLLVQWRVLVGACDSGRRYSVRNAMLPSFFPKELADKVLLIGKSINFIRRICQDRDPLTNTESKLHRAEFVRCPLAFDCPRVSSLHDQLTIRGQSHANFRARAVAVMVYSARISAQSKPWPHYGRPWTMCTLSSRRGCSKFSSESTSLWATFKQCDGGFRESVLRASAGLGDDLRSMSSLFVW
jgi:hypothetical protein